MLCSILELYTEKWYNVTDIDYRKKEASFMSLLGKKKKTPGIRNYIGEIPAERVGK